MRFPTAAFLMLAVLLLQPTDASAQAPAKNSSRKVSLQVTFVAVKASDLDALGIDFDLVPIPTPQAVPKQFLAFAAGSSIAQVYQRLTQTAGVQSHIFTPASAVVSDSVPTTFAVHTQFTDATPETIPNPEKSFPRLTSSSIVDGKATFTPHIGANDLVSLDMASPLGDGQQIHLGAVSSGQPTLIRTAAVKAQEANNTPGFAPQMQFGGRYIVSDAKDLLIFITPTILVGTPGRAVVLPPEKTISFQIENGNLQTAIIRIERQCGIQCIVQDGVDLRRTMSAGTGEEPLFEVLQFLASTANAQVTQNLDGVYVFMPKPAVDPERPPYLAPPNRFEGGFGNLSSSH